MRVTHTGQLQPSPCSRHRRWPLRQQVRKQRPMSRILETAREITRLSLPIKCVEAVFLAAYLTQGQRELERVPLSFKSSVDGQTYKHIVLALKLNSKWGCVGLSRRRELYYKKFAHDSLAGLVLEFQRSYSSVFHSLKRVKAGLPLPHEPVAGQRLDARSPQCVASPPSLSSCGFPHSRAHPHPLRRVRLLGLPAGALLRGAVRDGPNCRTRTDRPPAL